MVSEPSFETELVVDIQLFRGIRFPADIKFHQLLITGPPGSGKSALVQKIGGWPEEGYLDLGAKRWWACRLLSLRPREVHLGFPFVGYQESLSVFDKAWMQSNESPILDADRIIMPLCKRHFFQRNWRETYVFEFILPPAGWVYAQRKRRARRKTHRVDEYFDLALVERQLETLWIGARYLYYKGFRTYIREGLEGNLKHFVGSQA